MSSVDEQARVAAELILGAMRVGRSPEAAASDLIAGGYSQQLAEAGLARVNQRAEESRILRIPASLTDGATLPGAWYPGSHASDHFWPALEDELRRTGLPPTAIDSIDNASKKIVGLLAPPWQDEIRTRGLVLGHVQSGKTSNFTAVMAKAADVGYRLFIVLSGVHNNLRRQTQARLDAQLVEAAKRDEHRTTRWFPLTSETGDFGKQLIDADTLLTVADRYFLCVAKKNSTRMQNLVTWLEEAAPPTLRACPILVIDDEADQASVNTAAEEAERSRINKLLVRLLELPKTAYVGYTATPFANLFVNPEFPKDIYPRDFIVDLPRPADYFGPERLFGRDRLEHDEDDPDDGLNVIRRISDDEVRALTPPPPAKREGWAPEIVPSLVEAFFYFVLATAARRARGQDEHSTMLVHTTSLTKVHFVYQEPIRHLASQAHAAVLADDRRVLDRMEALWTREVTAVPAESMDESPVSFEQLLPHLADTFRGVEVLVDNYRSQDRLFYGEQRRVVVVIGGNTLSRGLTLEGLVVSYFARSANAYDTLLQMGRWFGYRRGYQDLPRIWISDQLEEWFRHLATVEAELRVDVGRYEDDLVTPLNFGVRIRTHPKLAATSTNKMRHALPVKVSYAGRRLQTILFNHRDPAWLRRNQNAAKELIRGAAARVGDPQDIGLGRTLFSDVPVGTVKAFLDEYAFHENAIELQRDALLNYIEEQNSFDDLLSWNVVVMGRKGSSLGGVDLGLAEPVGLINRARMDTTKPYADIKSLMSTRDRVVDLELAPEQRSGNDEQLAKLRPPGKGLLLLYPVSKDSTPLRSETRRKDLEAVEHIIGVGLVFPEVPPSRWDNVDYITVDLSRAAQPEVIGDEEEEENQAELEEALAADTEEDYVLPEDVFERS